MACSNTHEVNTMIDIRLAMRTTLLLVDDDTDQLELRATVLKMSGYTVVSAGGPLDAMSIMAQEHGENVDVAVLDYHMPVMNGCLLAGYLRIQYPDLKIILYSAALEIPEDEMSSVDVFVSKSEGIAPLLEQVSEFAEVRAAGVAGVQDLAWFARASL
jgi:CheY-like chemotaxis protein